VRLLKTECCVLFLLVLLLVAGCASSQEQLPAPDKSQLDLESVQTRAFDTADIKKTLRTVIATLQDLGFIIDKADAALSRVTATKLDKYALIMTVTVRPKGETQLSVRANAQLESKPVEDPGPYQQFFATLQKAILLAAHEVE
jgi:hypothetical protein